MVLRRLAVALLAIVTPVMLVAGPATAASYPPKPPTHQTLIAPGVVYGGSAAGVTTIAVCADQLAASVTVQQGVPFLLKVCGFVPGSAVNGYVRPPQGSKTLIGAFAADGNGKIVAGPFRLTAPGRFVVSLAGTGGTVTGLGVGGVGSRGMSRVFADPQRVVQVTLTVPAAGNSALPRTGGDGGGHSALTLGLGLGLSGVFLMLLAIGIRRRSVRAAA
jgi:hypothetical protein